jgi:hypothetical protein
MGQGMMESWEELLQRCELSLKLGLLDLRGLLSSRSTLLPTQDSANNNCAWLLLLFCRFCQF